MGGRMTRGLRRTIQKLEAIAETDHERARLIREEIRPEIEHRLSELENEVAGAREAASGPDPEYAASLYCRTVEVLPEHTARLTRKLERAVGARPPRRKAPWVEK